MKKVYLLFLVAFMIVFIATETTAQVNVTLRVDMQDQVISEDGVHVAGSFQGWDPSGTLMTPPVIGYVYEHTFQATPGDHVLYKYINGNSWSFPEQVPAVCGEDDSNGGYNRYFDVPAEDVIVDLVCFGSCLPCVLPPVDVTFQVDMANEVVAGGVFIAGDFNGWNTTSTPLTNTINDVYEVTLTLEAGNYYLYKYLNGTTYETVSPECAVGGYGNRELTAPEGTATLDLVCYSKCEPCESVTDISVTFQVDMSEADSISTAGIHLVGGFQGWLPAVTEMTDMGNNIFAYTTILQSGSYYEYKFVNDTTWAGAEQVPWYCAFNNNRAFTVPENDTVMPAVCFGSCVICEPPLFDVTFSVDMSTQIISEDGVHLAGSFQGWDPAATLMTPMGNNIYEITVPVGEGELHEYKFINGMQFDGAEIIIGECANFDGNREFFGPSANDVLPTVCFNECVECTTQLYEFHLSAMLEGPFNGTDMSTTLFDLDSLPLSQPYNMEPWNYDGGEYLTAEPGSDVVDWVYIQLRETDGDASTATLDKMVDHQAAILLSDGTIATPDGNPNIYFTGDFTEDLYILIYHRNHLAVMTATPIENVFGPYTYNFTDALSKAYLDGQKALGGGGMYGMIGGDSDASSTVDLDDKDINWTGEAGSAGYFGSDLNMDSQVNNPDKNDLWEPNLDAFSTVPN